MALLWWLSGIEPTCSAGDWIPGWGRFPGEGNGNLLLYSGLENPIDRGAWPVPIHRVAENQTWLKWLSTHVCTHIFKVYLEAFLWIWIWKKRQLSLSALNFYLLQIGEMCKLWYLHFNDFYLAHVIPYNIIPYLWFLIFLGVLLSFFPNSMKYNVV